MVFGKGDLWFAGLIHNKLNVNSKILLFRYLEIVCVCWLKYTEWDYNLAEEGNWMFRLSLYITDFYITKFFKLDRHSRSAEPFKPCCLGTYKGIVNVVWSDWCNFVWHSMWTLYTQITLYMAFTAYEYLYCCVYCEWGYGFFFFSSFKKCEWHYQP